MTTEPNYTDAQCETVSRYLRSCGKNQAADIINSLLSERQAAMQGQDGDWIEGYPNKIYASEWFIAQTKNRERVVLTALPEEYAYDFKTADETYIKKENIVRWMQFPDSQFIPAIQPPQPVRSVSDEDVEAALKAFEKVPVCNGSPNQISWLGFKRKDRVIAMRAALEHFAAIAQEKQS